MKYFKQRLFDRADIEQCEASIRNYFAELEKLRPRLSAKAYTFFAKARVHDGTLLRFGYSRPDRLPKREPNVFELEVLEGRYDVAKDDDKWTLRYFGVRRVRTDFKGAPPECFGDWLYHELTDAAGSGFLRHEIVFLSGATLAIEFQKVQAVRAVGLSRS